MCATCVKRDGPHPETEAIVDLYWMKAGGMPISRGELPADVWTCLGIYAGRNRMSLF